MPRALPDERRTHRSPRRAHTRRGRLGGEPQDDGESPGSPPKQARLDATVRGMTCGACAARIESELHGTNGVSAAHVNFAANRASVTYDPALLSERHLLDLIADLGFRATPGDLHFEDEEPRSKSTTALAITLALAAASMVISSISVLRFGGWQWLVLGITMPVVLIEGMVFHRPGWRAVRRGHATMDTLVSLGSLVAWGWSAVVTIGDLDGHVYFDTAAVIVAVVLLGRRLESRARRRAGDAIGALVGLSAGLVRLPDGSEIPPSQLAVGMRFLVRPGERIAADGVVAEGHSAVDTSIVTGEPVPREVGPGDEVTGGMLNTHGSLVVEARRVGADGTLAQVVRLVSEALSRKAPIQRLADRISAVFVPVVVVVAVATLVAWLFLGPVGTAISPAVAVLIVACPCALGLATPAAFMAGSGRGARMGVIIRGPDALEAARGVDVVALDKTGTVTEGHLEVVAVEVVDGIDAGTLLAAAAALEARSEHPVAEAIVRAGRGGSVESFGAVEGDGTIERGGTVEGVGSIEGGKAVESSGAVEGCESIEGDRTVDGGGSTDCAESVEGDGTVAGDGSVAIGAYVEGVRIDGRHPPRGEFAVADFRNLPGFGVEGRVVRTAAVTGSASGWPGSGTADTTEGSMGVGRMQAHAPADGTDGTEADQGLMTVGRAELFEQIPPALERAAADHAAAGRTLVFVGAGRSAQGFLALADRVKPSSAAAVARWRGDGIDVVLLSGDNRAAAEQVGRQVGIDRVVAGLTPAGKVTEIERLQAAGRRVAMVGDGINDAPALAAAEVGVAIGTGADVAAEASDLTLVGDDLRLAADALTLARRTLGTIRGNLFWAFAYNTAAIPLAAVGLLRPEIAAAAMGLSSLFVLGNSLRLNRFAGLRTAS